MVKGLRAVVRRKWIVRTRCFAAAGLAAAIGLLVPPECVRAQFNSPPIELSSTVTVDAADSAARVHLERIRAQVADLQWDEAVEGLRGLMESQGAKMVPLSSTQHINLTDYCHLQIASLPAEALTLYRDRVDSLARRWYDAALATRDAVRLEQLLAAMFCSSWGDDALLALGEIELERANFAAARCHLERLIEMPPVRIAAGPYQAARHRADLPAEIAALLDASYRADSPEEAKYFVLSAEQLTDAQSDALVRFWREQALSLTRLAYPGSELSRADVRARLVLVSILEGSLSRAQSELAAFTRLHPDARGQFGGREANYAEALSALAAAAVAWPTVPTGPPAHWPTFAGSASRTTVLPRQIDLGRQAWEPISLGEPQAADGANSRVFSPRRIGEDAQRLLSFHPLVVDDLILFNNAARIFAFRLHTGKPAWPVEAPDRQPGEIYSDSQAQAISRASRVGVPRFTMTAHAGRLYARMGSQVTSQPLDGNERTSGALVCLDLTAEGKLLWTARPAERGARDEGNWAFEGAPLVDGDNLYIGMRKSDVRPQAHVACYDANTGRRRWRVMVCAADTPGGGQLEEITHNLLTLEQGVLYYNTNLGAVCAIAARDGRVQWLTRYERARQARPDGQIRRSAHFYRDLNPCVYWGALVFVAPSDSEAVLAIDAASGEIIWQTQLPEDVVHLLGVGQGNLIASGDRLWWIDALSGKVLHRWPDSGPVGAGRGVLSGDEVLWPTAGALYVFPQDPRAIVGLRDPISLAGGRQAAGGNIVVAGDILLVAAADRLYGFEQHGGAKGSMQAKERRGSPAAAQQAKGETREDGR